MKIERSDLKIVASISAIVIFGVLCYWLGVIEQPVSTGTQNCLTSLDLNRDDIGASIVLSRFCEGLGLQSSVYWQQDEGGQVYAMPICMQIAK